MAWLLRIGFKHSLIGITVHFPTNSRFRRYSMRTLFCSTWLWLRWCLLPLTLSMSILAQADDATSELTAQQCSSIRSKLAQMTGVMVPFEDFPRLEQVARKGELSLVGLLGEPDTTLPAKIARLQSLSPIPLLFASDEESRSVQRLENLIYKLPTSRRMVSSGSSSVRDLFEDYGRAMRSLGVQINMAPVADVGRGPGIGYRSFGKDPEQVREFGQAVIDGLTAAGVMPVIKHFPGHGSATADTHEGLAKTPPLVALMPELNVFRSLISNDTAIMVGHLVIPDLTSGQPASLSHMAITQLLRETLGFDGLVITDALDMSAITDSYSQSSAGLQSIYAGADIALVSTLAQQQQLLDKLEQAYNNGDLSPQRIGDSVQRVLEAKTRLGNSTFKQVKLAHVRCDG